MFNINNLYIKLQPVEYIFAGEKSVKKSLWAGAKAAKGGDNKNLWK
jgi:hypothetical protein